MTKQTLKKLVWRLVIPVSVAILPTIILVHFGYSDKKGGGFSFPWSSSTSREKTGNSSPTTNTESSTSVSAAPAPQPDPGQKDNGNGAGGEKFSEVEIEKAFEGYLKCSPILMETSGAKIIRLGNGNFVILSIASTAIKDDSVEERLRAEKVCRIKALANIIAEKSGVQVVREEALKEKSVVVTEDGKDAGKSVSEILQVTKTKVEGIARDMPVIGKWKSKQGDIHYLAIGAICDSKGEPIR